ncbi:TPA: helix-turn-helix domain-containing protein [Escherichia coli]|nr:helix-turn-helix domain-containing protein [Escherichia coli]HCQ0091582.1 helix-turn-helix domain-containing protein [Escherichia coli]
MKDKVLSSILYWIQCNMVTGKNIDDLVTMTGYSRRTLELWFRERYGITPGDYLHRMRMSRASVLLRLTAMSVTEIAELFHYSSTQNFSRAFQRFSGTSPTAYRNNTEWDCSPLQVSLLQEGLLSSDVSEVYFPDRYLLGETFHCSDELFNNGSEKITRLIRQEVERKSTTSHSGVWVAADIIKRDTISTDTQRRLEVCITSGGLTAGADHRTLLLPEGRYLHYFYSGSWQNYGFISKMLYTRFMATGKYRRRPGYDCACFHNETGINDVACDIYIPIS